MLTHILMVIAANEAAFELRFDGRVPSWARLVQIEMMPWLVAIRSLLFVPFGVYQGSWRYAGIWDLRNILMSVGASSVVFYLATRVVAGSAPYPRSILVLDALVLAFLVGGLRLATRFHPDRCFNPRRPQAKKKKVLIFGAGEAGELIVRDIRKNGSYGYDAIGFVDDDPSKLGERIHGVPVLGTRHDLRRIMAERNPDEVLLAMPAAGPSTVRGVVRALEPFKTRITVLPNLRDILDGRVTVSQIRHLAIEDLLPRAPVGLDQAPLRHLLAGRRVLVTGAGGSIGSELCQQIAALRPESLVLYERSENSLYAVTNALIDRGLVSPVHPVIADITDVGRLDSVMGLFRPEIVFHAAAHKHVPLMEAHPCEAVKNNVAGTRLVAEAARRHGVARFILISSDKAVNPTSIMGTTKRVAEMIVMSQGRDASTSFLTVRFGNVLGSAGSAIPRFIEQIKAGGPVTITHPEMRRYFMLLPEAAQLVLHVAGRGRQGGVYVLDMGEQIKVVEMARNLIRLYGLAPDDDIQVTFLGPRPGEKLFEELVGAGETVQASSIERVFEVTSDKLPDPEWLDAQVRELERFAQQGNATGVIRALKLIVPEFTGRPWEMPSIEPPRRRELEAFGRQPVESSATG